MYTGKEERPRSLIVIDASCWNQLVKCKFFTPLISSQCSLLIALKTSENLRFSHVLRGIKKETL